MSSFCRKAAWSCSCIAGKLTNILIWEDLIFGRMAMASCCGSLSKGSRPRTRASQAGAEVLEPIAINPNANHLEFWLRDPNGYVVVVAGHYGELGSFAKNAA
jgi:hypothetical protein